MKKQKKHCVNLVVKEEHTTTFKLSHGLIKTCIYAHIKSIFSNQFNQEQQQRELEKENKLLKKANGLKKRPSSFPRIKICKVSVHSTLS